MLSDFALLHSAQALELFKPDDKSKFSKNQKVLTFVWTSQKLSVFIAIRPSESLNRYHAQAIVKERFMGETLVSV
jgi:predicted phosphoadenosine phosphosulfate sulfurtransferase